MRVVFFATLEEQINWLERMLGDKQIWIQIRYQENETVKLKKFQSPMLSGFRDFVLKECPHMIYLGRNSFSPAVLNANDLDFEKSMAIALIAALPAKENIILEGQFATLDKDRYRVAPSVLKEFFGWFSKVKRDFLREHISTDHIIVSKANFGNYKEYPCKGTYVSKVIAANPNAFNLKQAETGTVDFFVRPKA
jgi:hypothetical protein